MNYKINARFQTFSLPSLSRVLGTMTEGLGFKIQALRFKLLIIKIIRITEISVDAYASTRDEFYRNNLIFKLLHIYSVKHATRNTKQETRNTKKT